MRSAVSRTILAALVYLFLFVRFELLTKKARISFVVGFASQ